MIQSNSMIYNITTNAELASILNYFNDDYIINIVNHSIQNNFNPFSQPLANLVDSFEMQYKSIFDVYGTLEEIVQKRYYTYNYILDIVCNYFNLDYTTENLDIYSTASIIYDFLVSGFTTGIVKFFTEYIVKEKNDIYTALNLASLKKNKDSTTLYSKKIFYKNAKIAAINANLELVLHSMKAFDITLEDIVTTIYPKASAQFILEIIKPRMDFYKTIYCSLLNNPEKLPLLATSIRLNLQSNYADMQTLDI